MSLERASSIALITACSLVTVYAAFGLYRNVLPKTRPHLYEAGDKIKDTADLNLAKAPVTLLLFTRSACRFCEASMPFYGRLTEAARTGGTRIISVTDEDLGENRAYLTSHGIVTEGYLAAGPNGIRFFGTPDLVLVRDGGTVVKSWHGMLRPTKETEVLQAVQLYGTAAARSLP